MNSKFFADAVQDQGSLTTTTTACAALLAKPDILSAFDVAVERNGVTRERRACRLLYLSVTTRVFPAPQQISAITKAQSSAGKSFVAQRVFDFFTEDKDYLYFSAMSPKAIAYSKGKISLRHKTVFIVEASGVAMGDDATMLRQMISEGRVRHLTVIKSAGKELRVEGPMNVVMATTAVSVDPELETRAICLPLDESEDQTRAIMRGKARRAAGGGSVKPDLSEWCKLQRWLASDESEKRVVIPFAEALTELIANPRAVRWRRDISKVLNLIRASAFLHQQTRPRTSGGRVVATLADYAIVRELVDDLLAVDTGAQVKEVIRDLIGAVKKHGGATTQSALVKALNKHKSTISRQVAEAVDGGWLERDGDTLRPGLPLPGEGGVLPELHKLQAVAGGLATKKPL